MPAPLLFKCTLNINNYCFTRVSHEIFDAFFDFTCIQVALRERQLGRRMSVMQSTVSE